VLVRVIDGWTAIQSTPQQCVWYKFWIMHVEEVGLHFAKDLPDTEVTENGASEPTFLERKGMNMNAVFRLVGGGNR